MPLGYNGAMPDLLPPFVRVRGARCHVFVRPCLPPDVTSVLETMPGVDCFTGPGETSIAIPVHAYETVWPFLSSAIQRFTAQGWVASVLWGWRKDYKGRPAPYLPFPVQVDPERVPGLAPATYELQLPHQVAAWRRFFTRGCSLEEVPTGGGKTLIALGAAAGCRSMGWRVLLVCRPGSEGHWEAEIEKWVDPTVVGGITILRGENGCAVRIYQEKRKEVLIPLLPWEKVRELAKANGIKGLGPKLAGAWVVGDPLPATLVSKAVRESVVAFGFARAETIVSEPRRYVIFDEDIGQVVRTYTDADGRELGQQDGSFRFVPALEQAETAARLLNDTLRTQAQIVIVSSSVLTNRRKSLRAWEPQVVILDESHEYADWSRWTRIPPKEVGHRPTYVLKESQAASGWYVSERASALLLLSATPDPDRRRQLYAQYDLLDPKGWGSFRQWTQRYCGAREQEVGAGRVIWNSSGELRKGVPIPVPPEIEAELRARGQWVHAITPRSESHRAIPPINRQLVWLGKDRLATPAKDPEFRLPTRTMHDKLNRLLDLAAEMKRTEAVKRGWSRLQDGTRGVILTGSHASANRIAESLRKKVGDKLYTDEKTGNVIQYKVVLSHGGTDDQEDRRPLLLDFMRCQQCGKVNTSACGHKSPGVLVGTTDAWGQGWDGMQFVHWASIVRLPWNHGRLLQLEGRFERLGGLWSVEVEYLLALHTIDERLLRTVLGKGEASLRLFGRDDLERLTRGLREEESEADILGAMLAGLLGEDEEGDEDEEPFDVRSTVERAVERGTDREEF